MSKDLKEASIQELEEELKQRREEERLATKPQAKDQIDWTRVLDEAQSQIDYVSEWQELPSKDYRNSIWHAVLTAVYGPDVFKWWNENT